MFNKLAAPFPPEAISWRAQSLTADGNKAMALAYIDARDVMRRFDDVCGPENWQDRYAETAKGRLIGTIEVRTDLGWVSKSDGAGDTDVEGEKGAISDAFKRTAVKWGVGRYLYDVEVVWAPCETYERNGKKHWKAWKPEAARMFAAALLKAAKAPHATPQSAPATELPTGPINDKTRDWLAAQVDATGKPVGELCKAFDVTSLKALTYEQMPAVKAWIEERKAA
jgi:hypothetical protein